jgi:hypothetical protein
MTNNPEYDRDMARIRRDGPKATVFTNSGAMAKDKVYPPSVPSASPSYGLPISIEPTYGRTSNGTDWTNAPTTAAPRHQSRHPSPGLPRKPASKLVSLAIIVATIMGAFIGAATVGPQATNEDLFNHVAVGLPIGFFIVPVLLIVFRGKKASGKR